VNRDRPAAACEHVGDRRNAILHYWHWRRSLSIDPGQPEASLNRIR